MIRGLSATEIVRVWEWGQQKHPVDRALGLLALAQPDLTPTQIAQLSVGQRNSRLLSLREQTLGSTLNGYAECTQCAEKLEFSVAVADIRLPEPTQHEFELSIQGFELRWRLPNSMDLASIVGFSDVDAARQLLVESCVLEANQSGRSINVVELPAEVIPSLANAVIAHDPQAEMRFAMECPACGWQWSVQFDIVAYFWTELGDRVKRLLYHVDALARTYGWREADILAMSATRRQFYLDLVTGEQ